MWNALMRYLKNFTKRYSYESRNRVRNDCGKNYKY